MSSMIFKVEPGTTDRYVVWSTTTDSPIAVGSRVDMLRWLQPPVGDLDPTRASALMAWVDETGTSEWEGRGGWEDPDPIPVGELSPGDGWYQMSRGNLPVLVDAIAAGDREAIYQMLVRYA